MTRKLSKTNLLRDNTRSRYDIIADLRRNPSSRRNQIFRRVSWSRHFVQNILDELCADHLVQIAPAVLTEHRYLVPEAGIKLLERPRP